MESLLRHPLSGLSTVPLISQADRSKKNGHFHCQGDIQGRMKVSSLSKERHVLGHCHGKEICWETL